MREQLLALYKLQQIDSKALEVEKTATELPIRIKALETELEQQRSELGALHTEAEGKRTEQRDSENQAGDESGKAQKWKRRLNDYKNPREYQALSREVEQAERHAHDLELKVITLAEEIETKQKVILEKETELKAREAVVRAEVRELREREAKIAREAAEVRRGREAIMKIIPPAMVTKYERLRERRSGLAVALTKGSSCSGCNVEVRPQQMVEVRKLNSVQSCPSCNRILVLESLVLPEKEAHA